MTKLEIKKKVIKVGSSYGILLPKSLIETKVLVEGKEYLFTVSEVEE